MKNKKVKTIKDRLKEKEIEKELKEKLKIDNNSTVVVVKKNFFVQVLNFLEGAIGKIIKLTFILVITVFSSIGLTVLLNESLREVFIDMVSKTFM